LETNCSCDEDIQFSGFNFLNSADIEIGKLGKALLSHSTLVSFAADACSESGQLAANFFPRRHAPLRRMNELDWNGPLGRKMIVDFWWIRVVQKFFTALMGTPFKAQYSGLT
jgi:hypothetical protein